MRLLVLLALACGCTILDRPLNAPSNDKATVMVLSNRLGGPLRRIARHGYIAVRPAHAESWTIWECCPPSSHESSDPFNPSFGDEVRLHGVHRGGDAERMITCIGPMTTIYGNPSYIMYPGPNSNSYVDAILRECDIPTDLPATAVGKDWRGLMGISWTSGGTGGQIETPLVGVRIGLKEGIAIHVMALEIGVDLWPPALLLPVGEGRLGFADR